MSASNHLPHISLLLGLVAVALASAIAILGNNASALFVVLTTLFLIPILATTLIVLVWSGFRVYRFVLGSQRKAFLSSVKHSIALDGDNDDGSATRVPPLGLVRDEAKLLAQHMPILGDAQEKERTMFHMFEKSAKKFPNSLCHGTLSSKLQFEWESYEQVLQDIMVIGLGLESMNLFTELPSTTFPFVKNLRTVGVFGVNSTSWVRGEYAVLSRSGTTVPLYASLNTESVAYVLSLTGISTVICTQPETCQRCIEAKPNSPSLRTVILPFEPESSLRSATIAAGLTLVTFDELRKKGKEAQINKSFPPRPPTPETMMTFCFTSGSTGPPKGALITHRSMLMNVVGTYERLRYGFGEPGTTIYLSFLPLAHQMERLVLGCIHSCAGRIGFSRGKPELIMADVAILRPTLFVAVPRLFSRIMQVIDTSAAKAGGIKAALFKHAVQVKLQDYAGYGLVTHPVWDALVFNKIRTKLGLDRVRGVVTGSAPMQAATLDFLSVVLAAPFANGYGQTEQTCAMTIEDFNLVVGGLSSRPAHAGGPLLTFEVKLFPVPLMEYLPTDRTHKGMPVLGRGEVCCRGPCNMQGYYAMEEKTKATIDEDGWLHTGDCGAWLPNGQLIIVDRISNVFKLAQAEFVNLDRTERAVLSCPLLATGFAFGTTLNSRLVCVAVVNREALDAAWAAEGAGKERSKDTEADFIRERAVKACREFGLAGYEIPGGWHFLDTPFTIDSGILTPTFKIVRNVAKKMFQDEIRHMYKGLGEEVEL